MSDAAAKALDLFTADIGNDEGTGEWFEVTQSQIDQFADITHDHQFIHVDPERAATTPFGTTIAHGFLTLSMLTHLVGSVPTDAKAYQGILMGVNYGFEKVRFISPVKVNSKIRMRRELMNVELKGNAINLTQKCTVEIEGEGKPACVGEWITRILYS